MADDRQKRVRVATARKQDQRERMRGAYCAGGVALHCRACRRRSRRSLQRTQIVHDLHNQHGGQRR
jgi:hypothetical protein